MTPLPPMCPDFTMAVRVAELLAELLGWFGHVRDRLGMHVIVRDRLGPCGIVSESFGTMWHSLDCLDGL